MSSFKNIRKVSVPKIRFKADDRSEFAEWQENQLLDLSTKKSSKVTAKDIEDNDGDYIVFGASGHFRNINSYTESEPYIAIVKDGAGAGRLFLMPEKSSVLGTLEIVKPNLNIQLNFLFYRMQLINFSSYIKGSTIPHVYFKDYSQEKIYLPCLEEQTKIANFLSAVDKNIDLLKKEHELLIQYKKGMMQKLFSQQLRFKADNGSEFGEWEFIKLNQLGKSYNGLTGKTKDDFGNGDAYVTYKQIFDNREINLQKIDKVNIQPNETQNRVVKGDLFFTTSSEIPEEVAYCSAILDDFDYPLYLNSFCFGFRPNNQNQLNSNYASFFFRSNQFRNTILHLAQGSTRFNISKTAFMDVKIALPRVEEQTKIANFLSAIDQKIEVVAQQIEQAKTWKKGLMQKMFV